MSTESQINANRLNAQKSTGPKTPEGKAKVSQNAVTHGLFALRKESLGQQPVLDVENPAEYARLRDDFFGRFAPEGDYEIYLADRAVNAVWRLKRAERYETLVTNTLVARAGQEIMEQHGLTLETLAANFSPEDCLAAALERDFAKDHTLRRIQQYELCIDRTRRNSLKELHQVQPQRLQQTASSEVASTTQIAHSNTSQIENKENKPNIPNNTPKSNIEHRKSLMIDSMKLLENCITNPIGLDPLTKIMMKKDNFQRLVKKAM